MGFNSWKKPTKTSQATLGEPAHAGEYKVYKNHHLRAIEGHFGERLYWNCEKCDMTRRYARDIKKRCTD